MRTKLAIVVSFLLLGGASYVRAEEPSTSFQMEEMYKLAQSYRDLVEKRTRSAHVTGVTKANAFKAYVASILDAEDDIARYNDCGKRIALNDIAYRAAVMITSFPLDPSQSANDSLALALLIGCNGAREKQTQ